MNNNFRNKLIRFFYGRTGLDQLNKFLFVIYFILIIVNMFVGVRALVFAELLIMIILFYRFLSRNLVRRTAENRQYLKIQNKITSKFRVQKRKWNERKTHMYRKCPKCKTILRLPLKKGKNTCVCPKCSNEFQVKSFRSAKIN